MTTNTPIVSTPQIIAAAEQMSAAELEQLVSQVLALQAARRAPQLSADEAQCLRQINRGLPETDRNRLRELQTRRANDELSSAEYEELAKLTDYLEELHAERMEALAKLVEFHGVSLKEMMSQLNIIAR